MSALTPQQAAQAAATAAVTAAKALTEQHGVKIQFGDTPQHTHIWIDGHELTCVTRLMLVSDASTGPLHLTLECLIRPTHTPIIVEGTLLVEPGALEGIV